MTEDRFAKIRSEIDHITNITMYNQTRPYIKKLTKQEILRVECLKPKFQAPCQIYQKFKCVLKKNGLWKITACRDREMILKSFGKWFKINTYVKILQKVKKKDFMILLDVDDFTQCLRQWFLIGGNVPPLGNFAF